MNMYLQRRLNFLQLFDKQQQMPKTEEEVLIWAEYVMADMSPENLCMDGEANKAQVRAKKSALKKEWKELEAILGRKITEDEVFQFNFKRRAK